MRVAPSIWALKALGKSTAAIAEALNRREIKPLKRGRWHAPTVERILEPTEPSFPDLAKATAEAPNPWMAHARERATEVAPVVRELSAAMTAADVAAELTRRGVATPRGSRLWTVATVRRTLAQAEEWSRASLKAAA